MGSPGMVGKLHPEFLWRESGGKQKQTAWRLQEKMGEAGGAMDLAEMFERSESECGNESGGESPTSTQRDAGDEGLVLGGVGFEGAWWRNEKMLQTSKPNDEPCAAAANAT